MDRLLLNRIGAKNRMSPSFGWGNFSFRAAFTNPEFQSRIKAYPESASSSPHLLKKLAVPGHCVA